MTNIDSRLCLIANQMINWRIGQWFFVMISRFGDGVFWLVLSVILLIVYGSNEFHLIANLLTIVAIGGFIYFVLKAMTTRSRPYQADPRIRAGCHALDQYSFPSGHTMFAVAFSITISMYHPFLFWLVVPFAVLVAISRIVLGLHYPSDVIAGAAIGVVVANIQWI